MLGADSRGGPRRGAFDSLSTACADVAVWMGATGLVALARYDWAPGRVHWDAVAVLALFSVGGQVILGGLLVMYRHRYLLGSLDELRALGTSATAVAVLATSAVLVLRPAALPRSLPFLTWPLALLGMGAVRVARRLIAQADSKPQGAKPVLVLGAGWVGTALVLRMIRDPESPFLPVGFLDDDPAKRNLQIHGVRVRGAFGDLAAVARAAAATTVIVAVNAADSAMLRRISDAADEAGVECLVLPPLRDMLRGRQLSVASLRRLDVEDVIGRQPVDTDVESIAQYVTGRRVLVTGAGGSIGSELCRQLHRFGPAELVMLDRDESALHAVQLSIYGRALLESPEVALANIRDRRALGEVFAEHRPQVVFHAAALKHLNLLERYPHEALNSNVYGTLNVLVAAAANGVEHFVNISTDKAANPTSALGYSKRLAERLTAWFACHGDGGTFLSVRFGNVLGSRGSVLHTFAAQIDRGGPVTVTDAEVSRFFMTIPEACQLVVQAGAIGRGGEALVLDMGEPVKIVDVARRMIAMSGRAVDIVFTGLRPGEKMHEDLLADGENGERPVHPLISHVHVPTLDPAEIDAQPWVRAVRARGRALDPAAV